MAKGLQRILLGFLVLWMSFAGVISASAQTGLDVLVSQVSTLETPDAMTMKVYFNIYDPKTSLPVLETLAQTAQVTLPNLNYQVEAPIQKPDVPIYIVLILDASGSMSGAAEDLKRTAKEALNNTPDNAFFSVVQFDEEIKLLQDFTQNIAAVSFAIDQYRVSNRGTCMYDATYSAVESLQKAPVGRRAIILFTDGRDENASGQPCSDHTFLEVSEFAQKTHIPVNTVGLAYKASNLNEVELKGLSSSTGAFSAIAKLDDLGAAFQSVMNVLKSQWMIQVDIYPRKGNNQVLLALNLQNDEQISTTFTVESATDYPGPPSPVKAQMAGLQFVPENQSYDIQLSMTSFDLVEYVKVEVWDVKGGSKVAEFLFEGPGQNNVFNIPTEQMVVGREYELRMTAVSKQDQSRFAWATDSDGNKTTNLSHVFTYDPTANLPALEIQSVAQQNNDLMLTVKTTNSQLIGGFDGWLVDENTNTKVQGSDFTSSVADLNGSTLRIPLSQSKIPDGKYTVIVRVLGKEQQLYSTAQYPGLVYKAINPNLFQLIGAALIAAPVILFLVVAIILGVVGFMMYSSAREKSLTGTPVLQGRMGEKLKEGGKASGPVIPVADEEPLLARSRPAAPPAPVSAPQVSRPPAPPASVAPRPVPPPPPPADATMVPAATLMAETGQNATLLSSAAALPRAALVILQAPAGVTDAPKIMLDQFPFVLGRTEGNWVIREPNVSRRHAEIRFDAARTAYSVTDLGSSNGTRLNGQRLTPAQPMPLIHGAVLQLGPNVSIRFEIV